MKSKFLLAVGAIIGALILVLLDGRPMNIYKEHKLRKDIYAFVRKCSGETGGLTYDQVKIKITEGDRLFINASDGVLVAAAFYNPKDSTIYLPEAHRFEPQILGHEFVHTFGVYGHDSPIFKRCMLDKEQIYNLP